MSTWEELAQRDSCDFYFVFRGTFASGAAVRWGTSRPRFLAPALDPRMSLPAPIVAGMPETLAAPPERVSTSITLDNTDGALTNYFAGGSDTLTAYEGDSFLNLSGQIFLGLVDADGTTQEEAVTPTLCVAGSPTTNGTQITLPLSSDDSQILGPTEKMVRVADLLNPDRIDQVGEGDVCSRAGVETSAYVNSQLWTNFLTRCEKPDGYAPWIFGRTAFRLTRIAKAGILGGFTYLVGLTASEPNVSTFPSWDFHWTKHGPPIRLDDSAILIRQQFTYTRPDGTTLTAWILLLDFGPFVDDPHDEDTPLFAVPAPNANIGMPASTKATPSNIIRRIVTDLSSGGFTGIDSPSFNRAAKDVPVNGAFGGSVSSDASLAEVISHVCGATGISLWHGTDDALHALAQGAWDSSDVTEAAAAPDLREGDVMEGTWGERIPSGDERGAAATKVSVDWPSELVDFWGAENTRARAPGLTLLDIREPNEARISGAWVHAPSADRALAEVGGRRRHLLRRISFVTHAWIAARGIGSMVRVTHRFGMQSGGYVRRLLRLIRYEILPGEMAARCEWEDLDALERQHVGVLDSIDNWVRARGNGNSVTLDVSAGSVVITASAPMFDATMVDCSLWTPSASNAADRSRRIVAYVNTTTVQTDRAYVDAFSLKANSPCDPIDEPWMVMDNQTTKGSAYRSDYIRLCDEETGEFTDGTSGFSMS